MIHYIFGAGSLGMEVTSILSFVNGVNTLNWLDGNIIFVVDDQYLVDKRSDIKRIAINEFDISNETIVLAIGDPILRIAISNRFPNLNFSKSIIHPTASISPYSEMGLGCIIFPNVVIGPGVVIGNNCVIHSNSSINHNVQMEDFVTISSNVSINGHCIIRRGAFIGSNACLKQQTIIGENSIVGMGSVVINNVAPEQVVAGNPATFMKIRTKQLF